MGDQLPQMLSTYPWGQICEQWLFPLHPHSSLRYYGIPFCRTTLRAVRWNLKQLAFLGEQPSSLGSNSDQVWLQLLLTQRCGFGRWGASRMSLKSAEPRIIQA